MTTDIDKMTATQRQTEAAENLLNEVERQTDILIATNSALLPLSLSIKETATRMAKGFAKGLNFDPVQGPSDLLDEAALKADTIFALNQDLVNSIGVTDSAYKKVVAAQESLFENGAFYSSDMAYQGKNLRLYYEDESQLIKEYASVISDNLLMVHYAVETDAKQMRDITLMGRALGYKEDMLQTFLKRQFALTGKATDDLLHQTLAYALAAEKETGISSKIISEHMGVMMKEVSLFGDMVPEQMARAATEVAKLGLEMSTVTNVVKSFNSFDDAAGNVAKLTQALGIQVDVMDAVALANENPELLLDMFRQQFDAANIDVHSLSMPMKRALANIFGVNDTQEIEQMFGNASAGLDQFLTGADSALKGVGDDEIDSALNRADKNIAQLRVLTGTMTDAAEKAGKLQREAMSSALANSVNEIKDDMKGATFALVKAETELLKGGVLEPMLKSAEGIADQALGLMQNKFEKVAASIKAAQDKGTPGGIKITSDEWADIFERTMGADKASLKKARDRKKTFEENAKHFDANPPPGQTTWLSDLLDTGTDAPPALTTDALTPGDAVTLTDKIERLSTTKAAKDRSDAMQRAILDNAVDVKITLEWDASKNEIVVKSPSDTVRIPIKP